jgi:hypothetical protein
MDLFMNEKVIEESSLAREPFYLPDIPELPKRLLEIFRKVTK